MHFEPLDARRLLAVGLDPQFAAAGQYHFPKSYSPGLAITAAGDGAFVAGTGKNGPFVAKFDARGRLDTAFGVKGFATVSYEPDRLAYDETRRLLYAAGTPVGEPSGDTHPLQLTRLLASGAVDTAYADGGTFRYAQPVPTPGDNDSWTPDVRAHVERINLLTDGSAVLAVDRSVTLYDYFDAYAEQSLALFKLRPDGTRDARYGRRGQREIFSGNASTQYAIGDRDQTVEANLPTFGDVRTDATGTSRVLLYRVNGGGSSGFDDYTPEAREAVGRFQVKTRTVSSRGAIDEGTAKSWTLPDGAASDVAYAGFDGGVVKLVRTEFYTGDLKLYTLRDGRPAKARPLTLPGLDRVTRFSAAADGRYVAADSTHITRLLSDFTVDNTFARDGVATADDAFRGVFADTHGHVLATVATGVLEQFT